MLACHVAIPLFHGCAMCWKMCWKMLFFHAAEHLKKEKKREQWVKTYTRKRLHDAKNCCKLAYDDANTGFFFFFFFAHVAKTAGIECVASRPNNQAWGASLPSMYAYQTRASCRVLCYSKYTAGTSHFMYEKKKKTLVIFAPHNRDMGESSTAHSFSYFCISRKF